MEAVLFWCKDPKIHFARFPAEAVLVNRGDMDVGLDWKRVPADEVKPGDLVSVPTVLEPTEVSRTQLEGAPTGLVRATVVAILPLYRSPVQPWKPVL